MNNMIRRILHILGWIFFGLVLYVVLHRIAQDAQHLQRKQLLAQNKTGEGLLRRLYRMRGKQATDTIEERVRFTARVSSDSSERIERRAIVVRRPHARAVILICHGFMCTKDDVRFLRGILFNDYTTVSFDFRAHGESIAGQLCTFGHAEKEDVIGAVEYIRSQTDLKGLPIIVYGFSMGAVASIAAQAMRSDLFDAAIWDCPFDSTDNVISRMVSQLKINIAGFEFALPGRSLLQKYAYNPYVQDILKRTLKTVAAIDSASINTCMMPFDTVAEAKRVSIPALFIVCKNDTKAPVEAVISVYRAVKGYKQLWITNGRYHFDSFFYNPEKYAYVVGRFIEKAIDHKLVNDHKKRIIIDEPIVLQLQEQYLRAAEGY